MTESCRLWNEAIEARKRGDLYEYERLHAAHWAASEREAEQERAALGACPMEEAK